MEELTLTGAELQPGDTLLTDGATTDDHTQSYRLIVPVTLVERLRVAPGGQSGGDVWLWRTLDGGWYVRSHWCYRVVRSKTGNWSVFTLLWPTYVAARLTGMAPRG